MKNLVFDLFAVPGLAFDLDHFLDLLNLAFDPDFVFDLLVLFALLIFNHVLFLFI